MTHSNILLRMASYWDEHQDLDSDTAEDMLDFIRRLNLGNWSSKLKIKIIIFIRTYRMLHTVCNIRDQLLLKL